jgi:hypothetical protein
MYVSRLRSIAARPLPLPVHLSRKRLGAFTITRFVVYIEFPLQMVAAVIKLPGV